MWPPDSRITACNQFSKFIKTLVSISWLAVQITSLFFAEFVTGQGPEVQYTLLLRNLQRKSPLGLSQVILLAKPAGLSFSPWTPRQFIQKKTDGAFNVRKSSVLLENSFLWDLLVFWQDVSVQHFIIIDSPDWFIIKVIWTYHTFGWHSAPYCYFSLFYFCCRTFLEFSCPDFEFLTVCNSSNVRATFIRRTHPT